MAILIGAATPPDPDALYAAGNFPAAEAALGSATSPASTLTKCRLTLLDNQPQRALTCIDGLPGPETRPVLSLRAEASRRVGDFRAASGAYKALGDPARADQMAWFAAHPTQMTLGSRTLNIPFTATEPLPVLRGRAGVAAPCEFVLDTGAAETILAPELAETAKVTSFGAQTGVFAGGKQAGLVRGALASLSLGDLKIGPMPVSILDTSSFAQALNGQAVCGVIGMDVLSRFRATIDYPGGRLILAPRLGGAPAKGTQARLWLAGDHYLLTQGRVNGGLEGLFLLDTGLAGSAFAAPLSTLAAAGVKLDAPAVTGIGGGGAVTAQPFTLQTLSLGGVKETNVPGVAGVFPPQLETLSGAHISGLVSHGFLHRYAVTLDLVAMTVTLKGPSDK
jgi:predicted aspartyl protease